MTPAGTSNELDVQNRWVENTHTHTVSYVTVSCVTVSYVTVYYVTVSCVIVRYGIFSFVETLAPDQTILHKYRDRIQSLWFQLAGIQKKVAAQ